MATKGDTTKLKEIKVSENVGVVKKEEMPTTTPKPSAPEPEPKKTPTPNTPKPDNIPIPKIATKATLKDIGYKYAGKESLTESIKRAIPKQLIPTKRFGSIFGSIFLLVLIIAAFQFPFSDFMSGNIENITIDIGYPQPFLQLELVEADASPLRITNLILDLLIYIFLTYLIDITISLIVRNPLVRSKEDSKKVPTIFKDKKSTAAEKITGMVSK